MADLGLSDATPLGFTRRALEIFLNFTRNTGHKRPHLMDANDNYADLIMPMGDTQAQAVGNANAILPRTQKFGGAA